MLKVRVIPTLLYKSVGLVKGVGFNSWRRVDTVLPAIKVYNMREVDELILLDIEATNEKETRITMKSGIFHENVLCRFVWVAGFVILTRLRICSVQVQIRLQSTVRHMIICP